MPLSWKPTWSPSLPVSLGSGISWSTSSSLCWSSAWPVASPSLLLFSMSWWYCEVAPGVGHIERMEPAKPASSESKTILPLLEGQASPSPSSSCSEPSWLSSSSKRFWFLWCMAKKSYESKHLVKIKTNVPSSWAAAVAFFCALNSACIELKRDICSGVYPLEVPAVERLF